MEVCGVLRIERIERIERAGKRTVISLALLLAAGCQKNEESAPPIDTPPPELHATKPSADEGISSLSIKRLTIQRGDREVKILGLNSKDVAFAELSIRRGTVVTEDEVEVEGVELHVRYDDEAADHIA